MRDLSKFNKLEEYLKVKGIPFVDYRDIAVETIKVLPSAQPKQQWIPVSERLPEYGQEVLVTRHFLSDNQLKKNAITESFYVEVASWIGDEWTSYSDEYKIKRHLHKVIAWMPLPEPYKEVEAPEVRHGRWEFEAKWQYKNCDGRGMERKEIFGTTKRTCNRLKCSKCKKAVVIDDTIAYAYCPHCGAKMDLKEEAETEDES